MAAHQIAQGGAQADAGACGGVGLSGGDFLLAGDDPAGPDPFVLLAAAATVTRGTRLVAVVDTGTSEPYEVARKLATLDHLSGGRAGWRPTGDPARTAAFVAAVHALLGSWRDDDLVIAGATFVARPDVGSFRHRDAYFDIAGLFNVPPGPQGHPLILEPPPDGPR
ncbi:LLM class flavin-dependent oxidoreductase [Dactylosporangium sp. CA-233914]|uniref:LLM class flavin-dependent oxidoreductase n=1 Tax=Dactylosporangium sp. CA-233914 TaxID=3239934 RepID=UPI003D915E41